MTELEANLASDNQQINPCAVVVCGEKFLKAMDSFSLDLSSSSVSSVEDDSNSIKAVFEQKHCEICFQEIDSNTTPLSSCRFTSICYSCLRCYLELKINESNILFNGNIKCFCLHQCGHDLTPTEILLVISSTSPLSLTPTTDMTDTKPASNVPNSTPSEDLVEKYHRFHKNVIVASDPTKYWCPSSNCSGIATLFPSKSHEAQCELCHFKFCTRCQKEHSSWSPVCSLLHLQKNSNSTDESIQRWKSKHGGASRKCPKCRHHIEKNGGCNHMTCSFCKHEFCWKCKSNYHRGGCTAGKHLCRVLSFNQNHHWGYSPMTRALTKTLAAPVIISATCAGVGIGTGLVAVSAVTVLPYVGVKKFCQYLKETNSTLPPNNNRHLSARRPSLSRSPGSRQLDISLSSDDDDEEDSEDEMVDFDFEFEEGYPSKLSCWSHGYEEEEEAARNFDDRYFSDLEL
jgi:hypothetical protein